MLKQVQHDVFIFFLKRTSFLNLFQYHFRHPEFSSGSPKELKHAIQSLTQLAAKARAILPHRSCHPILWASGRSICLKILQQA